MRFGVDRLRRFCREEMKTEPDLATSFLFINKARDTLLLYFVDEHGEQTLTKRIEKGAFLLPVPAANEPSVVELAPSKLPALDRSDDARRLDALLAEILVDANGKTSSCGRSPCVRDRVEFPVDAFVIGEPVAVELVDWYWNRRPRFPTAAARSELGSDGSRCALALGR